MRARELYGQYHRLIDELAQSAGPRGEWRTGLRAHIDRFNVDAAALDFNSARLLREELCTQLEHEALHSTRQTSREILFAAVKWLEIND